MRVGCLKAVNILDKWRVANIGFDVYNDQLFGPANGIFVYMIDWHQLFGSRNQSQSK